MPDTLVELPLLAKPDTGDATPHESGHKHVAGLAEYVDDIPEPAGTLHACLGLAAIASGRVEAMDLEVVRNAPGVVGVLVHSDIPGANDIGSPALGDDPVLSAGEVRFLGQPLFIVAARSRGEARRAARLASVTYASADPVIDVAGARAAGGETVAPGMVLERGNPEEALARSAHRVSGSMAIGGQEHFYLEGQVALAVPGEDGEVTIWSATQHPSHVQDVVAGVLGVAAHLVRIQVRRLGGGFGGKETHATQFAVWAALAARALRRPVKIRPDRDDDMVMSGKRHDFVVDYDLGFDNDGLIEAVDSRFHARCGYSADLSLGVTDRALMHGANAYWFPQARLSSSLLRTNTVSNTAFRGYGGPQGILACERLIEEIAYALGKDPLDVRKANFLGETERNETPFHQPVRDNIMRRVVAELEQSSDYAARRAEIIEHNRRSEFVRRGIALTPVMFGIGFSKKALNQGGVLLTVYRDGSVDVNHGGTEMGQGVHTKVRRIVAEELCLELSQVRVSATATDKVPNASPTAGSLGTDLNGMAALNAAARMRARLTRFAAETFGIAEDEVRFAPGEIRAGEKCLTWPELVRMAHMDRVNLSATGFYATPHLQWDRKLGRGEPYLYFTYGASCSEVAVDTLTGEYAVRRVDILQDVGRSINRAVDLGQVEGGFIQGMGWLTTEELWWDEAGRLRTHAPSTYKIPLASDRPDIFNIALADWSENAAPTVRRSKAVGEPPIMLANSVFEAIGMAAASVADYRFAPLLDAPATPERVLMAMERLKRQARQDHRSGPSAAPSP